ncbi:thiol-disulfide oxidoreductase DCC family protein [Tundrisphaera sp. TA3]|uniref:thiol-disulfide oxidoreductase DCC family protein n=1 Tax=Tundrisphaera sp. TA3 TaxID=3435775 RepID=UPI003EBF40E7
MRHLYVLYDPRCGLCRGARAWLERQAWLVDLHFLAAGSRQAALAFPALPHGEEPEELVVVDEAGGVYRGGSAWIMCLYALEEYREWSTVLAGPALLPFARRAFDLISKRRAWLSIFLGMADAAEVAATLRRVPEPACTVGERWTMRRAR